MPIAHFTPAELPGTLAVLVFGIVVGTAVARRRTDALTFAVLGFCGLAALGSVLDHFNGISTAWKIAADTAFLCSGLVLLTVLARARGARRPDRATGSSHGG